jgi:hypothetical protein
MARSRQNAAGSINGTTDEAGTQRQRAPFWTQGIASVRVKTALSLVCVLPLLSAFAAAQRGGMFQGSASDPAINYLGAPVNNAVASLNQKLQQGAVRLSFEGRSGYLRSALAALDIPLDSQMLVFSPTSLQAPKINAANPRALFFADRVVLGWVRDGEVLEVAAQDATQGVVFYTLDQRATDAPQFKRMTTCLGCHSGGPTLGVPGLLMFTTRPATDQSAARSVTMDHRSLLKERWGGWFVTGSSGAAPHLGNMVKPLEDRPSRELSSVEGLFDPDGYRSKYSDIAALLVFSHQTHMTNLLTRAGWEARVADPALHPGAVAAPGENERIAEMMRGIANEVVDYLLFVDEPPLPAQIHGSSGFAERFSASGPRDSKGRSLHELDLKQRLMKYRCSYLIYSATFDALLPAVKEPIYQRMWQILSGQERDERYQAALSRSDRQAIVEILRDTKKDLPSYFQNVTK